MMRTSVRSLLFLHLAGMALVCSLGVQPRYSGAVASIDRRTRLLLVEDNLIAGKAMERAYTNGGFEVLRIMEGQAALDAYRRAFQDNIPFSIVVTDFNLESPVNPSAEKKDGDWVIRQIEAYCKDTPGCHPPFWGTVSGEGNQVNRGKGGEERLQFVSAGDETGIFDQLGVSESRIYLGKKPFQQSYVTGLHSKWLLFQSLPKARSTSPKLVRKKNEDSPKEMVEGQILLETIRSHGLTQGEIQREAPEGERWEKARQKLIAEQECKGERDCLGNLEDLQQLMSQIDLKARARIQKVESKLSLGEMRIYFNFCEEASDLAPEAAFLEPIWPEVKKKCPDLALAWRYWDSRETHCTAQLKRIVREQNRLRTSYPRYANTDLKKFLYVVGRKGSGVLQDLERTCGSPLHPSDPI